MRRHYHIYKPTKESAVNGITQIITSWDTLITSKEIMQMRLMSLIK